MKPSSIALCILLLASASCSDGESSQEPADASPVHDSGSSDTACGSGQTSEIRLTTDDGVALIADLYVAQDSTSPAVILLHMIPPSNSKANYPPAFTQAIQNSGISVLNLNRRGAPGSEGVAIDAYEGPSGKLDAKAAYDFLTTTCGVDAYAIVGASNGTTTAIDFAIYAAENEGIDTPSGIVALSGGSYTENQHRIADKLDALPDAAFFGYPESEASWNDGIEPLNSNWQFQMYSPGAHGSRLLSSNPESVDTIINFLSATLL